MKYYTSISIERDVWLKLKKYCETNRLIISAELEKAIEERLDDGRE